MTGSGATPLELQAAAVVAERVGGEARLRDRPGAPAGTHDFDITLRDGRQIALEITTIADQKVQSFYSVMGETDWLASGLRADWWVGLPEPEAGGRVMRIKRRKPKIIEALATLEAEGVSVLERDALAPWPRPPDSASPAVRDAIAKLTSAGVLFVRSTGGKPDGVARLLFSSHGGAVGDPDELNHLVVKCLRDNREKLEAAAEVSERHLFIWLGDSHPGAELAFSMLPPPPPPPPLIPATIDVVWLARLAWPIRLWRLRPPRGWEIVEIGRA